MFDGSFKSSRKVNLSGRKKPTTGYSARLASLSSSRGHKDDVLSGSKEELMLQNRLAREERHALKQRTAASTRIQAQFRRLRAAEQARAAVFNELERDLTQVVMTGDIQNKALPNQQLQGFLRQFLFFRPRKVENQVTKDRIRKVQDYLVFMLLVSSLKGEDECNLLKAEKNATWVYQVTKICEITLQTLVSEELETSVMNPAIAVNPYLLLLDTLTSGSRYVTLEGQTALSSQAKEDVSRVENDSHMLLGLDDEAFYDGQWPLRLTEVEAVSTFLKQFIYDMCWTITSNNTLSVGNMNETELVLFSAVVSSIKLFNQLYDRDCRRRFMPDGAWLWPSMPVIKEIVDLEVMKEDGNHDAHAIYMLMNGKASSPYARAALILVTIPQVLSFNERVQLFQKLLEDGKAQLGNIRDEFSRALQVRVKRDEIVDDSFDFFQKVCDTMSPAALKSRVKVTFINEQGLEEAGIDGGGVFKEFMDSLTKNAFSPEYGFFLETDEHLLYPNPGARYIVDTRKEALDRYRFLGRVLAKAVYENILVEPQFAAFFLNKLLGKFNYIDDLHSLDPELYKSLMRLKHYDGNVEDLALTFSVSEMEFGEVVTRNLVPDGANIPVTNENRIRYIHLMANYKLNVLSSIESAAFLKGFRDLIPGTWIQMFAPAELQMLIGGTATNIDINDWERNTVYGGGYHPSQRIIQWFWEIVRDDFTAEDRAALLKFITSCSRQPLLGFSKLVPQICIHQVRVEDDERLPSSATCMNLLKLPAYSNREAMRTKLLDAMHAVVMVDEDTTSDSKKKFKKAKKFPTKFTVDYVTPLKTQDERGTCWDFATVGVLENSYRQQGIAHGWLQDDEYMAISEQAYGAEVLRLCAGPPDSPQQVACLIPGNGIWKNTTEGGDATLLMYLVNGLKENIYPHSICPYYPDDGNDTLCVGLTPEKRKTNPLSLKLKRMDTLMDEASIKRAMVKHLGYNDLYRTKQGYTGGFILKNSWFDGIHPALGPMHARGSHSIKYWLQEITEWEEASMCPNSYDPENWYQCGNTAEVITAKRHGDP
ncbi:HECT E3 ubiquitin ligase, partial [Phytophthora palmivora]